MADEPDEIDDEDDEDEEPEVEDCPECRGSGMGMYDAYRCSACRGTGIYTNEDEDLEPL